MSETDIQAAILKVLDILPGCEAWRNSNSQKGRYRYGLHSRKHPKGSSDIIGIVQMPSGVGRFFAFEVKTAASAKHHSEHTARQAVFLDSVRSAGGFAAVITSVDGALVAIEEARKE